MQSTCVKSEILAGKLNHILTENMVQLRRISISCAQGRQIKRFLEHEH